MTGWLADAGTVVGLRLVGAGELSHELVAGRMRQWRVWSLTAPYEGEGIPGFAFTDLELKPLAFVAPVPRWMPVDRLPEDELRRLASRWLERNLPVGMWQRLRADDVGGPQKVLLGGRAEFFYAFVREGAYLPGFVYVTVQVYDGKVAGCSVSAPDTEVVPAPALSQEAAVAQGRLALTKAGIGAAELLHCRYGLLQEDLASYGGSAAYRLVFTGTADGRGDEAVAGQRVVQGVRVDGVSGEATLSGGPDPTAERLASWKTGVPAPLRVDWRADDGWPEWQTRNGDPLVYFGSNRAIPGRPGWCSRDTGIFVVDVRNRQPRCVVYGLDGCFERPSVGQLLVCQGDEPGQAIAIDTRTGDRRPVSSALRQIWSPAISPDGRWLAFVGGTDGGSEIKVQELGTKRRDQWVVSHLAGVDEVPVFSPDSAWVYFAHHSGVADGRPTCDLYRVRPRWPARENDPPECLARGFGGIERLSVFPDGESVLVWHPPLLSIVEVATATVTRVEWPELRDPDAPVTAPLEVLAPAVGPDGQTVAFAGRTFLDSHTPETYIYLVQLDGTRLRRITPRDNVVAPPYRFESGRLAFALPAGIGVDGMALRDPGAGAGQRP